MENAIVVLVVILRREKSFEQEKLRIHYLPNQKSRRKVLHCEGAKSQWYAEIPLD